VVLSTRFSLRASADRTSDLRFVVVFMSVVCTSCGPCQPPSSSSPGSRLACAPRPAAGGRPAG
jgi:hypothetical protein